MSICMNLSCSNFHKVCIMILILGHHSTWKFISQTGVVLMKNESNITFWYCEVLQRLNHELLGQPWKQKFTLQSRIWCISGRTITMGICYMNQQVIFVKLRLLLWDANVPKNRSHMHMNSCCTDVLINIHQVEDLNIALTLGI